MSLSSQKNIIRLGILFSGQGSNAENIVRKLHGQKIGKNHFKIVLSITNNPTAPGIKRLEKYGLKTKIINHKNYQTREDFDAALVGEIKKSSVQLCVLAGFMRILSPLFTSEIKAINLHPSLLPLFKGEGAIKRSFESEERLGGVSVHWVSEELDGGELIMQKSFEKAGLDFENYEKKIHDLEYEILPEAIIKIFEN